MRRITSATLTLLVAVAAPTPAQVVRQYGPHVHGITTLDIALDRQALQIALAAPGINMVGFEHPPHDAREKQQLDAALAALEAPGSWLQPAKAADCRLLDAHVEPHGFAAASPSAGHEHADIDARYDYRCDAPDALDHIDVHLTDRYPATHQVIANLVLPQRQDRQVLGPGDYRIVLSP
jgi:hypothetical protein